VQRFIVRFDARAPASARQAALDRAAQAQGRRARIDHATVGGYHVVVLSRALEAASARRFMARLGQEAAVASVAPDGRLQATATANDPMYSQQWFLQSPPENGGVRADQAWDRATGAGVLVAVVDTGITAHPELNARIVAGRDFITDVATAGDGDGRDADPADMGDWNTADQCDPATPARDSSWHGTHVAGIIAAATNNGQGVAGVAPDAQVLPVRALGHCGGWTSDIADAIQWAAGGPVPGVPANAHPADVINLSLGGEESCSPPLQAAIEFARAAGVVVVAAAGNNAGDDAARYAPANCEGVIVVGASNRVADYVGYGNIGRALDLSAPGGSSGNPVVSTWNLGTTTPGAPGYVGFTGTSMSTAVVSGIVALMQSAAPRAPADVEAILAGTAKRMLLCADGDCGAGIADARAAVDAVLDGALMISDAELIEGSRGEALVSVEVRLSRPMGAPVAFDLVTGNGPFANESATAGNDYLPLSLAGQVFAPGETLKRFNVRVLGDTLPEGDEMFTVALANVQGAAAPRPVARVRILEDDVQALANGITVGTYTGSVYFMRRLFYIEVPPGATSLQLHTTQEGGELGMGVTPGALPHHGEGVCWGIDWWGESFCTWKDPVPGRWYVMLYSNDYLNASLTMSYTAGAPPLLSIADASVPEGTAGTRALELPVTLSAPAAADVQFEVAVEPGTAAAGQDYLVPAPQVFTIPAGQSNVMVPVLVVGDTAVEANESFAVAVRNVQGATVARGQATGRISNDDLASLRIDDVAATEGDADATLRFSVRLSAPMPSPVAFDIRTVAGSAQAGNDFIPRALAGRYLDAGRTRQDFEVTLVGDDVGEGTESFTVRVENVVGAALQDGEATATVADDDAVAPSRLRGSGATPASASAKPRAPFAPGRRRP
jgi:serine protease